MSVKRSKAQTVACQARTEQKFHVHPSLYSQQAGNWGGGEFPLHGLYPLLHLKDKEDATKYKSNLSGHSAPICRVLTE